MKILKKATNAQKTDFLNDWKKWARADQLAPEKHWITWLILGGRGAGKTRTGAEWIHSLMTDKASYLAAGAAKSAALVGETYGDVREVMIEGPSGIRAIAHPAWRPTYEASRHRLVWPNGAVAQCFSAEDPEGLRGFQFEAAWSDEICKWRYDETTWSNLQLGLRLGDNPRQIVTTTPRPRALLKRLMKQETTVMSHASTYANADHLAETFINEVAAMYEGTALGRQELLGEIVEDQQGALWRWRMIEAARIDIAPEMSRIVVSVDPPVTSGDNADECGVIVAGISGEMAYVLADRSIAGATPLEWGQLVIDIFHQYKADRIVVEVNQGGDLVKTILHQLDDMVPVRPVYATRSKTARAEPIAALYERHLVRHVGAFPQLEDQMTTYTGERKGKSPDRLDALVWALTDLKMQKPQRPGIRFL